MLFREMIAVHRKNLTENTNTLYRQCVNPLEPSGYYMYHLLYHTKTRHSAHTLHICVPYESHNKQLLFPQTALTGSAL
jgi:hypothetical protein